MHTRAEWHRSPRASVAWHAEIGGSSRAAHGGLRVAIRSLVRSQGRSRVLPPGRSPVRSPGRGRSYFVADLNFEGAQQQAARRDDRLTGVKLLLSPVLVQQYHAIGRIEIFNHPTLAVVAETSVGL